MVDNFEEKMSLYIDMISEKGINADFDFIQKELDIRLYSYSSRESMLKRVKNPRLLEEVKKIKIEKAFVIMVLL